LNSAAKAVHAIGKGCAERLDFMHGLPVCRSSALPSEAMRKIGPPGFSEARSDQTKAKKEDSDAV
jgi:hypothetical protein